MTGIRSGSRRWTGWILLLALGFQPIVVAAAETLPPAVYFEAGGETYRFDYALFLETFEEFTTATDACVEISVSRAVSPGLVADGGFALGDPPAFENLVHLGPVVAGDRERTWEDLTDYRLCRSAAGVEMRLHAGGDRLSVAYPWEALTRDVSQLPPGADVTITVNGHTERTPASYLYQLALGLSVGDGGVSEAPLREEYGKLAVHFNDVSRFANALQGLLWASQHVRDSYRWPAPAPLTRSCAWPCTKCGLYAGALVVGGTAGLAAGCGAAVGTAGGLAAACVAAAVGYLTLTAKVLDACWECAECMDRPGGGKKKPEECPEDQHPCCEGEACCAGDLPEPPQCP